MSGQKTDIKQLLPYNNYQAIINANSPSAANPFATIADIAGGGGWALGGNAVGSVQNLGTTTNFDLPFITNNVERARIDTGGRFIVGAAVSQDAGSNIQAVGASFWSNTSYRIANNVGTLRGDISAGAVSAMLQSIGAVTNLVLRTQSAGDLIFQTNSTEIARILSTGEYGIGLITPTAKLHVRGINTSSGTLAFLVENASPTTLFKVRNNGRIEAGSDDGTNSIMSLVMHSGMDGGLQVWSPGFAKQQIRSFDNGASGYVRFGDGTGLTMDLYSQNTALGAGPNAFKLFVKASSTSMVQFSPVAGSGWVEFYSDGSNNPILYSGNAAGTPKINLTTNSSVSYLLADGGFVVGASVIDASAKVQIDSTTQGFLPPRMTTAQRTAIVSPATGLIVYDTTLNQWYGYNGSLWAILG
jgi:hypothetical protein